MFLEEPDDAVQHDDGGDGDRVGHLAERDRDDARADEQPDDRAVELAQKNAPRRRLGLPLDFVPAVLDQPPRGVRAGQPAQCRHDRSLMMRLQSRRTCSTRRPPAVAWVPDLVARPGVCQADGRNAGKFRRDAEKPATTTASASMNAPLPAVVARYGGC